VLHRPQIIFDRYHVVAKADEAVDEFPRSESKTRPELKRSRYVWLKKESFLAAKQPERLAWLTRPSMRLAAARAGTSESRAFHPCASLAWSHNARSRSFEAFWTSSPLRESVPAPEAHWLCTCGRSEHGTGVARLLSADPRHVLVRSHEHQRRAVVAARRIGRVREHAQGKP